MIAASGALPAGGCEPTAVFTVIHSSKQAQGSFPPMPSISSPCGIVGPPRRRPSERTYTIIRWFCVIVVGAFLLQGFVLARFMDTPRAVGFRFVVAAILAFNLLWWSIADRRLARFVASDRASGLCRLLIGSF